MLAAKGGGPAMRPVPSHRVWTLLARSERDAVVEMIIKALTEVVEHERLGQDPAHPPPAARRGLPPPVQPQAGPEELRERPQPAGAPRSPAGVGLAQGSDRADRR